jgi:hypothetical protein
MGTVSRQCLRASGQHLGGKTLAGYRTNTERSQPKPNSSRMTMEGEGNRLFKNLWLSDLEVASLFLRVALFLIRRGSGYVT